MDETNIAGTTELEETQIRVPGLQFWGCWQYPRSERLTLPHRHNQQAECVFAASGELQYRLFDETRILRKGQMLLILPGTMHCGAGEYDLAGEYYRFRLNLDCPDFLFINENAIARLSEELRRFGGLVLQGDDLAVSLARQLHRSLCGHAEAQHSAALLHALLSRLLWGGASAPHIESGIAAVLDYIKEHITERLTLADLHQATGIPISTLQHKIQAATGIGIKQLILSQKIARSKQYLRETRSPAAVAAKFSFESTGHYTKMFSKYAGMTPLEFLRTYPNGQQPRALVRHLSLSPLQKHVMATNRPGSPPDINRVPGMVVTARGTILCYWELRHGGDWDCYGIGCLRHGSSASPLSVPVWSELKQIVAAPENSRVNNPVMIARKDGTVLFLWVEDYLRAFCSISDDDGLTYHSKSEITPALAAIRERDTCGWDICALGPGHGIELRDGTLLAPFWLANSGERKHRPSVVGVLRSDDGGKTWQAGALITDQGAHFKNPSEVCLVELPGGDILMNLRHEGNVRCRAAAISRDGGLTFSRPKLIEALPDPICLGSMAMAPDGKTLAFCNCDSQAGRENLTLRLSADGGETWPAAQKIADVGCYSDLAFSPDGKQIYVFYEIGHYDGLVFECYNMEDFAL